MNLMNEEEAVGNVTSVANFSARGSNQPEEGEEYGGNTADISESMQTMTVEESRAADVEGEESDEEAEFEEVSEEEQEEKSARA